MTLSEWLNTWFELYTRDLRPNTRACYLRAVKAVPDELGAVDLSGLMPYQLQGWLVGVAAVHPRAAQLDRVALGRALGVAHDCGLINWQLTERNVTKPKHNARGTLVLSREMWQNYIAFIGQSLSVTSPADGGGLLALLLVALLGLRRGQALGLLWEDISGGRVEISRQWANIGEKWGLAPLKTRAAHRVLALPPWAAQMVEQLRPGAPGRVCEGLSPHQLRRMHQRVLIAIGCPDGCTLHGLRHTFATQAAAAGYPLKLLQVGLGHSKVAVTADLYAAHIAEPCTASVVLFPLSPADRARLEIV